jgi:tetratricopeptide (TPR) repeat protein
MEDVSPIRRNRWRDPFVIGVCVGVCGAAFSMVTVLSLRRDAPSSQQLLENGLFAAEWGDFGRARKVAMDLRSDGHIVESELVVSKILLSKGFLQPALDALQNFEAGEHEIIQQVLLAEAAQRAGRHGDVQQILTPLLSQHPEVAAAHRLLSATYYDIGAIDGAVHHLRQAADLEPTDPRPLRLLGLIYSDYELYDEAIPFYQESLRRSPNQPDRDDLLLELAKCFAKQRQYEEACSALDLRAPSPESEILRAECLLALGEQTVARQIVDSVLQEMPGNDAALLLSGTMFLEDGNTEAAMGPLTQAAEDPNNYLAHLNLSRALAQLGRDEEAIREQEAAETVRSLRKEFADLHKEAWENPGDPDVRIRLGELAARLGRPDLEKVWRDAAESVRAVRSSDD